MRALLLIPPAECLSAFWNNKEKKTILPSSIHTDAVDTEKDFFERIDDYDIGLISLHTRDKEMQRKLKTHFSVKTASTPVMAELRYPQACTAHDVFELEALGVGFYNPASQTPLAGQVKASVQHAHFRDNAKCFTRLPDIVLGPFALDIYSHTMSFRGRPYDLSPQQTYILRTLAEKFPHVATYADLAKTMGKGYDTKEDNKQISVAISRLMEKLGRQAYLLQRFENNNLITLNIDMQTLDSRFAEQCRIHDGFAGLRVNETRFEAEWKGQRLDLTIPETILLAAIVKLYPEMPSRKNIKDALEEKGFSESSLATFKSTLSQKLKQEGIAEIVSEKHADGKNSYRLAQPVPPKIIQERSVNGLLSPHMPIDNGDGRMPIAALTLPTVKP